MIRLFQTECEVVFDGFGDHRHIKTPPKVSHIRVEHGPREHLVRWCLSTFSMLYFSLLTQHEQFLSTPEVWGCEKCASENAHCFRTLVLNLYHGWEMEWVVAKGLKFPAIAHRIIVLFLSASKGTDVCRVSQANLWRWCWNCGWKLQMLCLTTWRLLLHLLRPVAGDSMWRCQYLLSAAILHLGRRRHVFVKCAAELNTRNRKPEATCSPRHVTHIVLSSSLFGISPIFILFCEDRSHPTKSTPSFRLWEQMFIYHASALKSSHLSERLRGFWSAISTLTSWIFVERYATWNATWIFVH